MKRLALLFAAAIAVVVIALPATAGAATFRGVVIAKDSARKALVTASSNGTVRTVRVHAGFKRVGVGGRVAVRAAKLPDGTFSASTVKSLGKTTRARVRGTVVKRLGARLVISAGGSVFALRIRGGKTSLSDRVEWDNYYIENWSLWLDVKIMLMTVWAVRRYFSQAE